MDYAQNPDIKRTWHWYFGAGAGLDFSSGFPVADTTGKLHSYESCAVMSDTAGNLLFYTDGDTVWDRRHIMMPNGYGLLGKCLDIGNSSAQVLIVPYPGKNNLYYIFTTDCAENFGVAGLNYSIIDMNMNNGFGDVIIKNHHLYSPTNEGICAITNCYRDSIYIITCKYNSKEFYTYLLTRGGLQLNPIISVGDTATSYGGQMKTSPNGEKIFFCGFIYEFDFNSGMLYNGKFLNVFNNGYGASFSWDSNKIFLTISGNLILEYNLNSDSMKVIYNGINNSEYFGMQLASDKKIYIASPNDTMISYIETNTNSTLLIPHQVSLLNKKCQWTLPTIIESYFNNENNSCIKSSENYNFSNTVLSVPNIFTPNNDNINDYFSVQISGYTNIEYFIYNRWGNLIHQGKKELNPEIKAEERLWDGRYKGNEVPAGVYFFLIKAIKMNGEEEIKKGFIQLLR